MYHLLSLLLLLSAVFYSEFIEWIFQVKIIC